MTFVLVPGAGGDGFYWHRLAPLLGPDTVSVDLPAADPDAVRGGRDPDAGWDEGELFFHDVPRSSTAATWWR